MVHNIIKILKTWENIEASHRIRVNKSALTANRNIEDVKPNYFFFNSTNQYNSA